MQEVFIAQEKSSVMFGTGRGGWNNHSRFTEYRSPMECTRTTAGRNNMPSVLTNLLIVVEKT
jgi:hypothetical protein